MGIIRHRYPKTKMASKRRSGLKQWELFNRYQAFKVRLRYGRRKLIHWWRKV
jgi:hypothetical protein